MKFKENNLEILTDVIAQTLHTRVSGDLSNHDIITILTAIDLYMSSIKDDATDQLLDETLTAIKSEVISEHDQATIENLLATAQTHGTDCTNMSLDDVTIKIKSAIKTACTGHDANDCFIVLSPALLVALQSARDTSDFKLAESPANLSFVKLVGTLSGIDVYCDAFNSTNTILVGTSNAIYALEYKNISII